MTLIHEMEVSNVKPMLLTFICDTSGSMEGSKINDAISGMEQIFRLSTGSDRVSLISFQSKVNVHHGLKHYSHVDWGRNKEALLGRVRGSTAMYDALKTAIETSPRDAIYKDFQKVFVLVTDGLDNRSTMTEDQMVDLVSKPGIANFTLLVIGVDLCEKSKSILEKLCMPRHCHLETPDTAGLAESFRLVQKKIVEVRRIVMEGVDNDHARGIMDGVQRMGASSGNASAGRTLQLPAARRT